MGLLSILVWLPIFGGFAVIFAGRGRDADAPGMRLDRWLSLGVAVAVFVLSLPLYTGFDTSTAAMQFV